MSTPTETINAWTKRNGLTATERIDPLSEGHYLMVTDENGYVAELWIVGADLIEAATMSGKYDGAEFLAMISA